MISFLALLLSLIGTVFVLIAGLGVVRMSDFFTRLHAASKAAPFGVTLLLIGVALEAGSWDVALRVVVIYTFLLGTAPIAAHVIARAAYLGGERIEFPCLDELEGRYDRKERTLHSSESRKQAEDARHDPNHPGDAGASDS